MKFQEFPESVPTLQMSFDKQVLEPAVTLLLLGIIFPHSCSLITLDLHLPLESERTIASAIIGARLDYCNSSLLAGTSALNLSRLQLVQIRCSGCCSKTLLLSYHTSPDCPTLASDLPEKRFWNCSTNSLLISCYTMMSIKESMPRNWHCLSRSTYQLHLTRLEHNILLRHLQYTFGIFGPALNWIGSYLYGLDHNLSN